MANYAPRRTTYDTGDRRWLPDMLKAETHGVTLNGDLFTAGLIKSGTHVGRVTAGVSAVRTATLRSTAGRPRTGIS